MSQEKEPTFKPLYPVSIEMRGDDFNFEQEINMEMAGHIIGYIAAERERRTKELFPNL